MASEEISALFESQKSNYDKVRLTTASERIAKLRKLLHNILANQSAIEQALKEDLRKPVQETGLSEIYPVTSEIKHACKHLRSWMAPRHLSNPLVFFGARASYRHEPRGMCLIISPWNYPFQLALSPLVSAIAAGNCVILKPSEFSPNVSQLLTKLLEETFQNSEVAVVQGDATVSTELLNLPFHHVFFTGSPAVGKIVMSAAAKNLASITLELGGKSPAIVDENYDVQDAARKIVWGKLLNSGQTCVAPDYALVHESQAAEFLQAAAHSVRSMYVNDKADYCRIISQKHFQRLQELLKNAVENGARVVIGGEADKETLSFGPVILSNVPHDSAILNEEIFGPILPVVTYKNLEEVFELIRSKSRPLSLYIFSKHPGRIETILQHTHSGGVCVNDVAVQFVDVELPFGGINNSGMGNSHGYFGFRAFSHERAILRQPKKGAMSFFYPPYKERMKKLIEWTIKYF